ncbi:MAG TPA: PHP domain-containing protein [Candidatus Nanopelagicales bacterium]
MTHSHDGHVHPHEHEHATDVEPDPAVDLGIDDGALSRLQLGRRNFLRAAGLLGAGVASMGVLPTVSAAADDAPRRSREGGFRWLAGDHHIHTQYSPDGQYRVIDHVRHAHAFGLDWMVITDHGSAQHARIGVEKVNPDIVAARDAVEDILVFQGLEWNIPAAEHGTVFVHPGPNEVAVLKAFENNYDGVVTATTTSNPGNEAVAVSGLQSLSIAVANRDVKDALMFANHPARKGLDSPHEIRGWRDAAPGIAVGMEGAPGHQAAGIAAPTGPGAGRGFYDNSPSSSSFPAYPLASYRTYGGFDWMTSTVGGLWDSLLSEGKPWWITANSDSHQVWSDTSVRGAGSDFATNGFFNDPEHATAPQLGNGDFWPGYYSRTHVGAEDFSYAAVMRGLREGRVWVDHGALIDALDVRLRAGDREVPLGGVLTARQGSPVQLVIRIRTASVPNWTQVVPKLAKVDVIRGDVTGDATDRDSFTAPGTKVVQTFDVSAQTGVISLSYDLGPLSGGFYVRLRGSDGNRLAPGLGGAAVDPAGPQLDVVGDADPWKDLWFYSNPMWALPRR